jgi:site-specific recombinase
MVCSALAAVSLASIETQSWLFVLATFILTLDAVLGGFIFVAKNEKEIKNSLSFVRKMRKFHKTSQINISYVDDSFGSII